jgi:ketosteroid isomerase-like protein
MWKGVLASGVGGASLETTDVETEGNLAYETGRYQMRSKDGKVLDRGKYVVVWKRSGSDWRIHRDIWNTSMPAGK